MSLTPKENQRTQRPIPPIGIHQAICYAIIDLGTHKGEWKGNVTWNQKIKICWEFPYLPEQVFSEGKQPQRLAIMQDYNLSSSTNSRLMKALMKWRSGSVDIKTDLPAFLGQSCQILVSHSTKDGITYANVDSNGEMVMAATQVDPNTGASVSVNYGKPKNQMVLFNLDQFSWQSFHSLFGFAQTKIKASQEWSNILQKYGPEPQQQNNNNGGQQQQVQQNNWGNQQQQGMVQNQQFMPQQQQNVAPQFNNQQQQQSIAPQFNNQQSQPQPQFQQQGMPQFGNPQVVQQTSMNQQGTGIPIMGNENMNPPF